MSKLRYYYMDWAKVIALYLVVVGHSLEYDDAVKWIYTFHMPFFFMANGVLSSKSKRMSAKKLIDRFVIPYFFFGFTVMTIDVIFFDLPLGTFLLHFLYENPRGHSGPLWFVRCLFYIKVLEIVFSFKRGRGILCVICLILVFFFGQILRHPQLTFITQSIIVYPFYYLGVRIYDYVCTRNYKQHWLTIAVVTLFVLSLMPLFYQTKLDIAILQNASSRYEIVAYYSFGIIGSLFVILLSKRFLTKENTLVTTLSRGAILVIPTHMIFIDILQDYLHSPWIDICVSIIFVLYIYPIRWMLKHAPRIMGNR